MGTEPKGVKGGAEPKWGTGEQSLRGERGTEPKGGTEDDGRRLDKERANSIFL